MKLFVPEKFKIWHKTEMVPEAKPVKIYWRNGQVRDGIKRLSDHRVSSRLRPAVSCPVTPDEDWNRRYLGDINDIRPEE